MLPSENSHGLETSIPANRLYENLNRRSDWMRNLNNLTVPISRLGSYEINAFGGLGRGGKYQPRNLLLESWHNFIQLDRHGRDSIHYQLLYQTHNPLLKNL